MNRHAGLAAGLVLMMLLVGACTATTAGDPVEVIQSGQAVPPAVNLSTAQAAAALYWAENNTYVGFNAATAKALEPSIQWNDSGVAVSGGVSIRGAGPTDVVLVAGGDAGASCVVLASGNVAATGSQDASSAATCTG